MQSRGPDSAGTWLNETKNAGFAHRRLSILDTSDLASQPMKDPNTGNTIVYNGEIYNYKDLKEELKLYKKATVYDLSTYFEEDFFETKKIVHIPLKYKG